jgi:hypothetical protein
MKKRRNYSRYDRYQKCLTYIKLLQEKFITGQNEREETTQDAIFTKSAAFASYEINYLTYITATYTRAKRRWHTPNLLLVKMKEKKLLKMQSLPKVLRSQAMRSTTTPYDNISNQSLFVGV